MKNTFIRCLLFGGLFMAAALDGGAQTQGDLGFVIRRHGEHSRFDDLPFGRRDHSFGINYEFHEDVAFWQVGINYAPQLKGDDNAETDENGDTVKSPNYALTPEINLIVKDRGYQAGLGIASTYYVTAGEDSEWTTVYWQLIMGIRLDISKRATLSGYAYYPFMHWGVVDRFAAKDIEYGIRLGCRF